MSRRPGTAGVDHLAPRAPASLALACAPRAGSPAGHDTLIIDYESERGGRLGVVFQVPKGQGRACDRWLAQCGVEVTHR